MPLIVHYSDCGHELSRGAQGFVWTTQIGISASPLVTKLPLIFRECVRDGYIPRQARFQSTNLTSIGNANFLAKYDSSGTLLWAQQAGGTNAQTIGQDVCVDTNGNVYVVGSFQGQTRFQNTTLTAVGSLGIGTVNNQFIAKYNSAGTLLWVRQAAGPGGGAAFGVAVDNGGNVYSTGQNETYAAWNSITVDKWNSSGTLLWDQEYSQLPNYNGGWHQGNSIKADASGNVYVTGEFGTTVTFGTTVLSTIGNAGSSIFILKLNSQGNVLWALQPAYSNLSYSNTGNAIALDGSAIARRRNLLRSHRLRN